MKSDSLSTESEVKNMHRESQIKYLRDAIIMLEYKQLSESIISIQDRTICPANDPNNSQINFPSTTSYFGEGFKFSKDNQLKGKKRGKGKRQRSSPGPRIDDLEYLVEFDPSTNIGPMWIRRNKMEKLNMFREDILTTSLYDATLAAKQKQSIVSNRYNSNVTVYIYIYIYIYIEGKPKT